MGYRCGPGGSDKLHPAPLGRSDPDLMFSTAYRSINIISVRYIQDAYNIQTCKFEISSIKHQQTLAQIMLACAVWHTIAARNCRKTIKLSMESSSRPPADVKTKRVRPTVGRRSESRRDVDVCPPSVPGRNLDIFRSITSILVLFFCACSPDLAKAPVEVLFKNSSFV